jgi:hypothetical protein
MRRVVQTDMDGSFGKSSSSSQSFSKVLTTGDEGVGDPNTEHPTPQTVGRRDLEFLNL